MEIVFFILWVIGILICVLIIPICDIVEKNIDEKSRFGKWWRNNIIGIEPKDDITE